MINPQKKTYISLAILLAITILLVFFGIRPVLEKIKKNSEDFIAERDKLFLSKREKENFRKTEALYQSYEKDFVKIDNLFINSDFPLEFILFLEDNARVSRLEIEISLAGKDARVNPWSSNSFQVSTVSTFPDLLRFLERLENSSYLIEILNLDIQSKQENLDIVGSKFLLKVFAK